MGVGGKNPESGAYQITYRISISINLNPKAPFRGLGALQGFGGKNPGSRE
jgi:hypothetical protein